MLGPTPRDVGVPPWDRLIQNRVWQIRAEFPIRTVRPSTQILSVAALRRSVEQHPGLLQPSFTPRPPLPALHVTQKAVVLIRVVLHYSSVFDDISLLALEGESLVALFQIGRGLHARALGDIRDRAASRHGHVPPVDDLAGNRAVSGTSVGGLILRLTDVFKTHLQGFVSLAYHVCSAPPQRRTVGFRVDSELDRVQRPASLLTITPAREREREEEEWGTVRAFTVNKMPVNCGSSTDGLVLSFSQRTTSWQSNLVFFCGRVCFV